MKKFLTFIFSATLVFIGCSYDDSDLWDKVDDLDDRVTSLEKALSQMNGDITTLQSLIEIIEDGGYITTFAPMASQEGWILTLSNGKTIEIFHGNTGKDAPIITALLDEEDGIYYWAQSKNGGIPEFLYADDLVTRFPVIGEKGADGDDAITPKIGVDKDGFWTIDYGDGNGQVRITDANGNDVLASDGSYTYLFVDVVDNGRYYTFYLADGSMIEILKRSAAEIVINAEDQEYFKFGQERMFPLQLENVVNAAYTGPYGWDIYVDLDWSELWIVAPADDSGRNQSSGMARITVNSIDGSSMTAALAVEARDYEVHTVTFEGDYWEPFVMANYAPGQYSTWALGLGMGGTSYSWTDEESKLQTLLPSDPGMLKYPWMLSSYNSKSLDTGSYASDSHDLYVYNPDNEDSMTGGGNNGSNNFIISYGYEDEMFPMGKPRMGFADGVARTIESVYVNSTCYFLGVTAHGNSLSPALAPGEDVILHAMGYDANGNMVGTVTMLYANYEFVTDKWTKWDISELGDIVTLEINMTRGTDNGYGFSLPAYYALDDITVRLK